MEKTNFTSHPKGWKSSILVLFALCLGLTSMANHGFEPSQIMEVNPGEDIIFMHDVRAVIQAQGMNCGTMVYNFYDGGGKGAPYEDRGDWDGPNNILDGGLVDDEVMGHQVFTICPENPMTQRIVSVTFQKFNLEWDRSYTDVDQDGGGSADESWIAETRRHFIKRDVLQIYDGAASAVTAAGVTVNGMTDTDFGAGHRLAGYRENTTENIPDDGDGSSDARDPGWHNFNQNAGVTSRMDEHEVLDGYRTEIRDFLEAITAVGNVCPTAGIGCTDAYLDGPDGLSSVGDDGEVNCHCIIDDQAGAPPEETPQNETVEFIYSNVTNGFDSGDDNGYDRDGNQLPNDGDPIYVGKGDVDADNFDTQNLNDGSGCITFRLVTDGTDVAEGWEATVEVEEFAPNAILAAFEDIDANTGVAGNGIVEIADCSDVIPDQCVEVDWGCGVTEDGTQEGNPFYEYEVYVNGNLVYNNVRPTEDEGDHDGNADDDSEKIIIPGSELFVGNNNVTVVLEFDPTDPSAVLSSDGPSTADEADEADEVEKVTVDLDFVVAATQNPLVCNDDLNIGLDADCSVEITPDVLLEAPCTGTGADAYRIHAELIELDEDYCIDQNGDCVFNAADVALVIANPGIVGINTSSLTVGTPGTYRYSISLGDQTCWGFFHLEDKKGPLCRPAGDDEANINYDIDCDDVVENNVNDPSGVDDLADEYILCKMIENHGVEIYFDILEPRDEDRNGDGDCTDAIDGDGDFLDCSGIDYIYFQDNHVEVCEFGDLTGFPIDETQYDVDEFEVCDIYSRTWFAIDKKGYQSQQGCTQYVFSLRPKAHRIELEQEVTFPCEIGESLVGPRFTSDGFIVNNGTGSEGPSMYNPGADVNQQVQVGANYGDKEWLLPPNEHSCKYAVSYHNDPQIDICATSYKKLYHWSVVDWCDGDRIYDEFTQLVKVVDDTAPSIFLPGTTTPADGTSFAVNVDFFDCFAVGNILDLTTVDNCAPETSEVHNVTIQRIITDPHQEDIFIHQFPNGGDLVNDLPAASAGTRLPEGQYIVTYFATDDCGNESTATLTMTVADQRAPIAICNNALNVTLTNFSGTLQARIHPEDLDDSSFDNCKEIGLLARSNDNASTVDNNWGEYVEFSCDDVNNTNLKVELLVYEDRNEDGEFIDNINNSTGFPTPDGVDDLDGGLSSTCWGIINVEDKDIPSIVCQDKVIDCDDVNLDNLLSQTFTEDSDGDGVADAYFCPPTFTGGCPNADDITLSLVVFPIDYDPVCKFGTFIRRWTATRVIDGVTRTAGCDQVIDVNFRSDWTMTFPIDEVIECTEEGDDIPEALSIDEIIDNDGCDQWGMEVIDETFDIIGQDGDGACYKVIRTYKFINWCTWDPTNTELGIVNRPEDMITSASRAVQLRHRSFEFGRNDFGDEDDADPYNEIISVFDITASFPGPNPPATNTPDDDGAMVLIDNDFDLGEDPQGTIFLFQRQYQERINNNDNVTGVYAENYGYFAYRQIIKVRDSQSPVITPIADRMVGDTTGICAAPVTICGPEVDECRPTYITSYTVVDQDGNLTASGLFPEGATPADCVDLGDLPLGTYTVTYLVEDGCGNAEDEIYEIMVADKKAPTAYCIFGLSVDLMPTGMVELWDTDFDAGSFDSCSEPVTFSFDADNTVHSAIFECEDVGTQNVDLWVHDAAGNSAFCTTFVVVQPNPNNDGSTGEECPELGGIVSGAIQTEAADDVEGVNVSLSGIEDVVVTTGVEGTFTFSGVEFGHDYTVTPEKDVNPLNGVSTFDLVLIRKHIIGVELLDSPYKLIAADVNRSNTVTTFDMVTLRKLILNIDTEFENNTSWRFVDAGYTFPTPSNPWTEVFPEIANINDIAENAQIDFVAVKVGDVNGSAIPNNLVSVDERTNGTFFFNVADQAVKAGQEVTVDFTADMVDIQGYQFTLNYNGLELVEVIEGAVKAENFGVFAAENTITTSWNGTATADDVLFSLVFTATTDAQLSSLLNVNSRLTAAEAYNKSNEVLDVAFNFDSGAVVAGAYELYQNTPNPFQGVTQIGFNLPQADQATITVHDVTGKVIKLIRGDFAKGFNQVTFDSKAAAATGVLYYTLETADFTATKKMVIIE